MDSTVGQDTFSLNWKNVKSYDIFTNVYDWVKHNKSANKFETNDLQKIYSTAVHFFLVVLPALFDTLYFKLHLFPILLGQRDAHWFYSVGIGLRLWEIEMNRKILTENRWRNLLNLLIFRLPGDRNANDNVSCKPARLRTRIKVGLIHDASWNINKTFY